MIFEIIFKRRHQHVMKNNLSKITIREAPTSGIDTFLDKNLFMI